MTEDNRIELKERKRKRLVSMCAHFIFLLILFILPELVLSIASPHRRVMFYTGFYVKTLIYIVAFYLNYFVIIDRTLSRRGGGLHLGRFLLWNFVILVVGVILGYLSVDISHYNRGTAPISIWQSALKSTAYMLRDAVMITLTVALSVALRLSTIWENINTQRQQMLTEQRTSELAQLKNQLNPHFLFNTLNAIYALVDISPDDSKKAIHRLSGLLRYMLYEDVSAVRLAQEVSFIEDCVSLIRLRISHREVVLNINIDGYENTIVPPLLFVTLVENAFKYGTTAADTHPIEISMSITDKHIVFKTCNSFSQNAYEKSAKDSGIGLTNLRRRLVLLYGSEAFLDTSVTDNLYSTTLTVPLKTPPSITQT